jgi:type IV secretion system protein VirB11
LEKLRRDFGPTFLAALNDPQTIEILLNADGTLWQEKLGGQMEIIGEMSAARAEAVMRTIAACLNTVITWDHPMLEGEFPLDGSRFAGQLPPIVSAPTFAVRKRASSVFTLGQYVEQGIMTPEQKQTLCSAIRVHQNILVIGGAGSGKTTLTNGLIHEMTCSCPTERIVIIEDTGEIQCAARNAVLFHTTAEVTMTKLLRTSLRMRPDRILVGEVRGPEALDLLMAWNTGHPGGIATLHANTASSGLTRLASLISMARDYPKPIEPLIGEAVDFIVHIAKENNSRIDSEIARCRDHYETPGWSIGLHKRCDRRRNEGWIKTRHDASRIPAVILNANALLHAAATFSPLHKLFAEAPPQEKESAETKLMFA